MVLPKVQTENQNRIFSQHFGFRKATPERQPYLADLRESRIAPLRKPSLSFSQLLHFKKFHSHLVLLTLISGAAATVMATGAFYQVSISPWAPGFWFLFIGGVYLLNWVTETQHDFINNPSRIQVVKHKFFYWSLTIFCLSASMAIAIAKGSLNFSLIFLFAVGFMYSIPSFPLLKQRRLVFVKLKDMTFIKSLLVAICFPLGSFETARLFANDVIQWNPNIAWFYMGYVLLMWLNTVFDDLLDIPGDIESGTVTVPIFLGEKNTIRWFLFIIMSWVCILCLFNMAGKISDQYLGLLLIQAIYPMTWLILRKFRPQSKLLLDFAIEFGLWVTAITISLANY